MMAITFVPRRYFFIEDRDGIIQYTRAPIASRETAIRVLTEVAQRSGFMVKEVTFDEWFPVFWASSDYRDDLPQDMTEEHFWRNQYL